MKALIVVGLMLAAAGCAPGAGQGSQPPAEGERPAAPRTLVMAHRYEVANMATKVVQSNGPTNTTRPFNGSLTLIDDKGQPLPYLAEALPALNTDTWRVSADGKMETTYRLRSGLTWHDGAPLNADDFVFAYK